MVISITERKQISIKILLFTRLMLWSQKCHRMISVICKSPAKLIIARAPADFQHFFPYVVTASVFDNIGRYPAFIEIDRASYFTDFIQMKQISRTMIIIRHYASKTCCKKGKKDLAIYGKKTEFLESIHIFKITKK